MARFRPCFALLVTAALLLSSTAMARVLVECRMSGRIGPECCCHSSDHADDEAATDLRGPALERPGCCEALQTDSSLPEGTTAPADTDTMPAIVSMSVIEPAGASPLVRTVHVPAQARAPPPQQPPLYLQHCAWLN